MLHLRIVVLSRPLVDDFWHANIKWRSCDLEIRWDFQPSWLDYIFFNPLLFFLNFGSILILPKILRWPGIFIAQYNIFGEYSCYS